LDVEPPAQTWLNPAGSETVACFGSKIAVIFLLLMVKQQSNVNGKLFTHYSQMNTIESQNRLRFEFSDLDGESLLRELILYISQQCAEDPTFGAVKLNKILFYSDFLSYYQFGEPIAGVEYQRLPNGPAPKRMLPIRSKMEQDGDIAIEKLAVFDKQQHRCVPRRDPDLNRFKARDIAVVDRLIRTLWGKTATEVSEMSHRRAWRIAKDKQSIPYQAILLSDDDEFSDAEIDRVSELNREHQWE
jgi:hypothetical protein